MQRVPVAGSSRGFLFPLRHLNRSSHPLRSRIHRTRIASRHRLRYAKRIRRQWYPNVSSARQVTSRLLSGLAQPAAAETLPLPVVSLRFLLSSEVEVRVPHGTRHHNAGHCIRQRVASTTHGSRFETHTERRTRRDEVHAEHRFRASSEPRVNRDIGILLAFS